jgi:uncharacterized heparinase superfamily protein
VTRGQASLVTSVWPGARRYVQTLRYLSANQIRHRAARAIRRRSGLHGATALPGLAVDHSGPPLVPGWSVAGQPGPWADDRDRAVGMAKAVAAGQFTFLGKTAHLPGAPLPWHDPAYSQLWRYQLHYFGYATDLVLWAGEGGAAAAEATRAFVRLASDWIRANPPPAGDGWHPYTVSLRLVNWIHAAQGLPLAEQAPAFGPTLLRSMTQQARYLARNLEFDVRGNHLLENLRALLACSYYFAGPEPRAWRTTALTHLRTEVAEQVLADGAHFERTPGYHLIVLQVLLEMAVWLERGGPGAPGWLQDALRRMLDYLVGILPPSGQVPLLKDTAWDIVPAPESVLAAGAILFHEPRWKRSARLPLHPVLLFGEVGAAAYASWPVNSAPVTSRAYPAGGYYIMRDDARGDHLIFDAGKPCPDYLPAHAHADMLSYELTVGGQRVVVDSGVYEYAAGPWRNYFRSTRAHNTVEIAQTNQSDVWASFRVGRRARPGPTVWRCAETYAIAQCSHDGYQRLPTPVTHRRTLLWLQDHLWLIADQLLGAGRTQAASHLHLHPAITPALHDANTWRLDGAPRPLWITSFGGGAWAVHQGEEHPPQGWYSERFGERHPNAVLTLNATPELPFLFGYVIALDAPASVRQHTDHSGAVLAIAHGSQEYTLNLTDLQVRPAS